VHLERMPTAPGKHRATLAHSLRDSLTLDPNRRAFAIGVEEQG